MLGNRCIARAVIPVLSVSPHLTKLSVMGRHVIGRDELGRSYRVDVRAELILHFNGYIGDLRQLIGQQSHGLCALYRQLIMLLNHLGMQLCSSHSTRRILRRN